MHMKTFLARTTPQRGFIALISAIVISTILLSLAVTLGSSTFFSRFDVLNSEYKRISLGLAEACVNSALGKIGSDYNYSVTSDSAYSSSRGGAVVSLGSAYGSALDCVIYPLTHTDAGGKRTFTISTQGKFHGAFSNVSVSALAQDPLSAPVVPPPACALNPTAISVPSGQSISVAWSTSGNPTSFTMDHGVGTLSPFATGSKTFTPSGGAGDVTYTATASNAGGSSTCTLVVTIAAAPIAPSCADTVMMLDRTGSMSGTDLSNERSASNAVVNLYAGVSSHPKVGVGSFGAYPNASLPAGGAAIPTNGQLSASYSTLTSIISQITGSNSSVGSNLGAAINVSATELASARHDPTKEKVLIFVSDGIPNEPSSSVTAETGFATATAAAQNASGDAWTNPAGAYSAGDATDAGAHRERYSGFGLSVPTNATVTGIQVKTDAFSSSSAGSANSVTLGAATSIGSYDQWSTGGLLGLLGKVNAVSGNDGNTSYVSETSNNEAETFNFPGAGLPTGSTIDSVTISAVAATSGGNSQLKLRAERGTGTGNQSDDAGTSLTSATYNTINRTMTTNPFTGSAWTLSEVNAWTTRFGVVRGTSGGGSPRVTRLYVTVTYRTPILCTLGVDLSWNGGSTWTTERTQTLTVTPATYTLSGWTGHTWVPGDFATNNFRVRIHELSSGPTCHVDTLSTNVTYSTPVNPTQYVTSAANAAKAAGVNIFAIHFGDSSGQSLMGSVASPSSLSQSSIVSAARSGTTVTITTSAPHRLTANERIQVTGVSNSVFNGTYTVTSVVNGTSFRYTTSGSGTATGTGGIVLPTNLFIAPSSSAMSGIFQSIGAQVCPAAAPDCSNGVDDDGDGLVDEHDAGCHTDGSAANAASYDASDNDEWSPPPAPVPPLPPPPPPNISIGSWQELP